MDWERKIQFIWLIVVWYFGVVCFGHHLLITGEGHDHGHAESKGMEIMIPENYSIHDPPPLQDGKPTQAQFYILLVDIRDIDEVKEELTLEFNLQMYWKDARLAHWTELRNNKSKNTAHLFGVLNPTLIKDIWHPDIFIDHVKKIEQPKVISTPASLRIYFADGTFRYSGRFMMKLSCQMVFHYYPADTQRCGISIKSYSYSNETLFVTWHQRKKPGIKKGVSLPNFEVALGNVEDFIIPTISTRPSVYAGIRFTVILRRHLGFHLIQTYLPSCLFVVVSFLTFLISHENMFQCLTLSMTILLTLTSMFGAVKQNTPSVSYIKGLDIWMVTCIFMVVFTLLQHTALIKLRQIEKRLSQPKSDEEEGQKDADGMKNNKGKGGVFNLTHLRKRRKKKKREDDGMMMPSLESQNPLNPNYHRCTNKCRTCSSISSSEEDQETQIPGLGQVSPTTATTTTGFPVSTLNPTGAMILGLPTTATFPLMRKQSKKIKYSQSMELLCSKLIPISFAIFNLIYWPWLLNSADYYNMVEFRDTNYID